MTGSKSPNAEALPDSAETELRRPSLLVIGCALGMSVSVAPIYLSTFSIFLLPISTEFGWSRGEMSALFAMTALAIAIASPVIGVLMKRFGARRVLMIGIASFAASLLMVSRVPDNFPTYLLLAGIVGLTGAAANTFVYVSILPQWFSDRLGMMMGISMTGIGLGQTVSPLLSQALISELGWRNAYVCLAALPIMIALPCVLFLIKERATSAQPEKNGSEQGDVRMFDVLTSPPFLLLGGSFLVIAAAASGVGLHTVPVLIDRGLTPLEAASIAAASGIAVFVGRLGTGVLLDYVGARTVGAGVFAAAALAPVFLTSYAPTSLLPLVPILLGLALGAEGDLMPYSVRRRFGLQNYSVIYGWLFLLFNAGVLIGPLMMGAYHDQTGGYDGMLFAITAAVTVAYPAFWWAIDGSD